MDSDTKSNLIKRRGVIKASLTRLNTFINSNERTTDINLVRVKYERLLIIYEQYNEIQSQLECENIDEHVADREVFEENYDETKAKFMTILDKVTNDALSNKSLSSASSSNHKRRIKLPIINLTKFTGVITEFRHYYDMFCSLIIKNDELDNVQRFHYLLSSLSGEPHKLLQNLPVTDSNFTVAWKLICDRYNNSKLIASAHAKQLLSLPSATKLSSCNLRSLVNQAISNVNALDALNLNIPLHEVLLIQAIVDRVDEVTRREWEIETATKEFPKLEELYTFLEKRCQALDVTTSNHERKGKLSEQHNDKSTFRQVKSSYVAVNNNACILCSEEHTLHKCTKFKDLSIEQRIKFVKEHKLCLNCLKEGHQFAHCTSRTCYNCGYKHHTLLHKDGKSNQGFHQSPTNNRSTGRTFTRDDRQGRESASYYSLKANNQTQVLLATALVKVRNNNGQWRICRALLDSGSMSNFITESAVQLLGLKKGSNQITMQGISDISTESKHSVNVQLQSMTSDYGTTINCAVLPRITNQLPGSYIEYQDWNLPQEIQLADPTFNEPGRIDILLGAEIFLHILQNEKQTRSGNYPVLQRTKLGWIVSGKFDTKHTHKPVTQQTFFTQTIALEQQLRHFWELEELNSPVRSAEERQCEQHFINHTSRDSTGRFVVRLPLRSDPSQLGESRQTAMVRLQHLEARFKRNPELREEYTDFLTEYAVLKHMEPVTEEDEESQPKYYLPHHPVIKDSSTTTKVRAVFDASMKTTSGMSLNDLLQVGPTIQQDLFSIILRFRIHKICFTADIAKMYRQILVAPEDRDLQRILWRTSPAEPVQEYRLTTVTYGTASAPFLAVRCLHQLATEEEQHFPVAAEVIKRDMYVDDLISGEQNIEGALQLQKQLIELLNSGGFSLRKWSSNEPALLEAIPAELRETTFPLQLDKDDSVRTLGLLWHPTTDQLQIAYDTNKLATLHKQTVTKRTVLAIVSSIFDPIGLISPVVILCKMFLQQLWQENLNWDDPIPMILYEKWQQIQSQLTIIPRIRIDRLVVNKDYSTVELHGFSDASEKAYGSCIYLRSCDSNGKTTISLLCSKSKVAPLKKISLPRLELCGALLLARLVKKVIDSMTINFARICLWTDSKIVLSWIAASPTKWKTFVGNRVSEIQDLTMTSNWRHVSSQDNPADVISRGSTPEALIANKLWWNGPQWLASDPESWPNSTVVQSDGLPEQRNVSNILTVTCIQEDIIQRFSKLIHLQRIVAWCYRFIANARQTSSLRKSGTLTPEELQRALHKCIKCTQEKEYSHEIQALSKSQPIAKDSKLSSLCPILDNEGLLRVGGRLQNSSLPYEQRHQIILSTEHHLTRLIIEHEHLRLLHAGNQLTISSLRQSYWIPKAKQVVRKIIHKCITCQKLSAQAAEQLMGNLPRHRVQPSMPFINVGVDFTGAFYLKTGLRRSKTLVKAYIAIFICLTTRAIHLEVVGDMTSAAFIAALKRFIARRGRCCNIYSDNGSNFVAANRELQELHSLFKSQQHQEVLDQFSTQEGIQWHFIPPRSPHFGGIWEAGVKSLKHHLRRTMGNSHLTFEELTTLVTQIEGCLNSRPLIPLSNDPNDPQPLTPGHFIVGRPLTAIPEPNLQTTKLGLLSRWQFLQRQLQQFWTRWSSDYLNQLQQRTKWRRVQHNIEPGTLVLIKEDNAPPLTWRMGVIESCHPGSDGLVRVATVRTSTGLYKRSISKLCPLLATQDDN